MSAIDTAALRELLAKATPGDTYIAKGDSFWTSGIDVGDHGNRVVAYGASEAEADALRDHLFSLFLDTTDEAQRLRGLLESGLEPGNIEGHALLGPILAVRRKAAADFKNPQFNGQRGEDFDAGLLAAFHAVEAAIRAALTGDKPNG